MKKFETAGWFRKFEKEPRHAQKVREFGSIGEERYLWRSARNIPDWGVFDPGKSEVCRRGELA
jgi:hypothetical protein